jgi:hypothetical protein
MGGPFGGGFQHGPDYLLDFFIPDFARCSWSRFVPERVYTAANKTISPVPNRERSGPGYRRNRRVTHSFGTFENDSCTEHQATVLPSFYDLVQLFSLAF